MLYRHQLSPQLLELARGLHSIRAESDDASGHPFQALAEISNRFQLAGQVDKGVRSLISELAKLFDVGFRTAEIGLPDPRHLGVHLPDAVAGGIGGR